MFNYFTEDTEHYRLRVDHLRELYSQGSYMPFDKLSYQLFGIIASPSYLIDNATSELVRGFINELLEIDCEVIGTYVSEHENILLIRYR